MPTGLERLQGLQLRQREPAQIPKEESNSLLGLFGAAIGLMTP
jgi:hypothetical protein